jgi:Calcineurin-like phosphoesterase/Iron/zinc purple acid phosphatase-like protein C
MRLNRRLALRILALAIGAAVPAPLCAQTLARGPYLQLLTTHSVTIVWRTDVPAACALDVHATGAPSTVVQGQTSDVCEVPVDNLTPGESYGYRPLADGVPIDVESTFKTDDPTKPFMFLVYGDHGNHNSSTQIPIRDLMVAAQPDFVVSVGDMVYPNGGAQYFDSKFFLPYADLLRRVMIWPSVGNHDDQADSGGSWRDAFVTPANNPDGDEDYYSFDAGNAHFVVLESNDPMAPGGAQARFLDQDLTASEALWKFVVFHHTIYSSGMHHGSALTIRANIVPLLDQHKVDLVLMGHEHNYERTYPMLGDQVVGAGQGTVYLTTGGGGADLYDVGTSDFTAYSESAFNFVRITVDKGTLHGEMIRDDGVVRDTFTLVKPLPATTTTVSTTTTITMASTSTTSTTILSLCAPGTDCDDQNRCTDDGCDALTGGCLHQAISGCCRTDAECEDGELCTADECSGAVCGHAPVGFATVRYDIDQSVRVDGCVGDELPRPVSRLVSRASRQILRAATAGRSRQAKHLVRGAAAKLGRAARTADKAARKGRISGGCAGDLVRVFGGIPFECLLDPEGSGATR